MSDNKDIEILTNYIGGTFVAPQCGKYIDNVNPATNQVISHVPRSNAEDVQKAVEAASAAFPKWSALPADVRANYLEKIANTIESRLDEWAALESKDSGKPFSLAKRVDIPRAIANFRFFAGAIRHDFTESHAMSDALNYTHRQAVGVAGLITPWNLPIYLLSWKVAPALAMGNVVIAKPSELTPLTAMALARVCHEIGLPHGVFNLVHGLGGEVGQSLVAHKDIHLISFTGGTATGEIVARTAAPLFKKLSLELGGKNSTVVFADCDFTKAVDGVIRSSFANQGQICLCGSRVFIQDTIFDRFLEAMVEQVKTLAPGDPSTSNYGSLVSQQHRDKIEYYVDLARKDGGKIVYGGARPSLPEPFSGGAFYLPTIITGLSPASRCSREEIFGPVITVHPFSTEAEVTAEISAVRYGLAGSLWTSNLQVAHRVSRAWQTGMVWVNCWLHRDLRVPFGGWKDSGTGTEGGRYSLDFYSQVKNICIHHGDS